MRPFQLLLLVCCLTGGPLSSATDSTPPAQLASTGWAGSERCADCHQPQYDLWRDSHHDNAMQEVSESSVLGNFNDSEFIYGDKTSRFFRKDGEYFVSTDGPDGKITDYRIEYVFGVYPLQQYLIAFPGGRLQTLSIAWDSRPASAGGQRWYHLYPDEVIDHDDPLHWTGPYQNWNLQCAECHSTNLAKNFNAAENGYQTTWSEIDVGCEACHGPGAGHIALAENGRLDSAPHAGFPLNLAERGEWGWPDGESIARRTGKLKNSTQVEACGRCHARRGSLGDYQYGDSLLDSHRVSLLQAPLYYPDGQILDEVYVYGSFLQSKMSQAGVVCSNCHDPHSNQLRAPGNAVCAQCHKPAVFDQTSHHHHAADSSGAACANCHMPERNYMIIDGRRDHSMRVPRPDLSVVIGTPNACTQCHQDQDPDWALDSLRKWGVQFRDTSDHPSRSMVHARRGDNRAVPGLMQIAQDPDAPAIWRATAMVELGGFQNQEAYQTAISLLQSNDPMLRWSAVRTMALLPIAQRYVTLRPFIADHNGTVRAEVAQQLAGVPLDQLGTAAAAKLQALFDEYESTLIQHADMPQVQLELGVFYASRGSWDAAEAAYQRAIDLNPQLLAAYLNTADLYRTLGRDDAGRALLLKAGAIAPEQGVVWHALGLLETRADNREQGLTYLARAAALESEGVQHRYVYGVALHDSGDIEESLKVLKSALSIAPENVDVLVALATYSREAGRMADARRYAGKLRQLMPDNPGIQQFYDSL